MPLTATTSTTASPGAGATPAADEGMLIIYGRGGSLGNFKLFADDLVKTDGKGYAKNQIHIENIERRDAFFDLLRKAPFKFKIKELHIYSHSTGAALYLGYGDSALDRQRQSIAMLGRASYVTVLNTEAGAIFTDDLTRKPYSEYAAEIRQKFATGAKIKIWGCNSAVSDWIWGFGEVDPIYYWRALNDLNTPKPSLAQAFADYFHAATFGAGSGSSIQVRFEGTWMSPVTYQQKTGRTVVGEPEILRLAPDEGDFKEFKPK